MAATTTPSLESAEEVASKAMHKRYEGLVMVRNKAVKGKGAWYWAHFEPLLIHNTETGHPKAVKLRCSLCDAVFLASNPSCTASEHLKRGTCPNFNNNNLVAKPICSVSPTSASAFVVVSHHNRSSSYNVSSSFVDPLYHVSASVADLVPQQQHHLVLSGGKEDLGALAMLEDSVKKLKSPKLSSTWSILNKTQIDSAFDILADWVVESCGSVSFSSLEHRKFKAFLQQVGLPPIYAT